MKIPDRRNRVQLQFRLPQELYFLEQNKAIYQYNASSLMLQGFLLDSSA